jgi:hypothetical protein
LLRHSWLARVAGFAYVEISSPEIFVPDPTEKLVGAIHQFAAGQSARLFVVLQRSDERLISYLRSREIPFVALDGVPAYGEEYGAHFTREGNQSASHLLLDFLNEQLGKD